ncbi:MAG: YeeE/YedE family protein [Halolamina sp.]
MPLDFAVLFPRGVVQYLLGGLLIGAATAAIYRGTGIAAGASTFLESTLSYVSARPRFQQSRFVRSRDWRLVFTFGIVLGAAVYTAISSDPWFVTDVSPTRLFVGGVLVGVGTRVGKGCTSGHGICGVGSLSDASLTNVATFVLVAGGTAHLLFAMGVRP